MKMPFLSRRVTFHQKNDKIKNQKIKNKIFGPPRHVIPRWKGITLGLKMAPKKIPGRTLSGHRAQKSSFLKALFSHDFTYEHGRARQFGR